MSDPYGARHPEVRVLRDLARDARARADAEACLLEGPRVIDAALDRDADVLAAYLAFGAARAFPALVARLEGAGIPVHALKEGVLEKVGTTRTPQPVLAVARWRFTPLADVVRAATEGLVVVVVGVADPGNLGTILRSAEASGCAAVVIAGPGVDVRSPKVVRASAGAVFGVPVADAPDATVVLAALGAAGIRTFAAVAHDGVDPGDVDLGRGAAIVVGNEAHGLAPDLRSHVDASVTLPMAGVAESLNVAMATTVLCFEAARQRSVAGGTAQRNGGR